MGTTLPIFPSPTPSRNCAPRPPSFPASEPRSHPLVEVLPPTKGVEAVVAPWIVIRTEAVQEGGPEDNPHREALPSEIPDHDFQALPGLRRAEGYVIIFDDAHAGHVVDDADPLRVHA